MEDKLLTQKEKVLIAKRTVELQLNKSSGKVTTLEEFKNELGITNKDGKKIVQGTSSPRS